MQFRESFLMALNAVRVNKLRSALTLLGIVIGVFSIIAVMTATRVLQSSIENGLSMLGSNTFQIQKRPMMMVGGPGTWMKYRNRKDITVEQGLKVKERMTLAESVGIEVWNTNGIVVKYKGVQTNPNVSLCGENPEGFPTNDWVIKEGRSINDEDDALSREVAVLGNDVLQKISPHANPIGDDVIVDGHKYTVIGYLETKGSGFGQSADNFVVIPLHTFLNHYGRNQDSHIMVKAASQEVYEDAIDEARSILRTIRKVPPGQDDDFAIFSNDSLIKQFDELTFYIKVGVAFISFIALLAAGVGIMNIMLVSVTERTREIGIRKAIGAQKKNVMAQFVTEAILLCEVGGVVGVILGILGGNVAALSFRIPAVIPYDWAVIGLVVCSIVGIIFGTYPAWKAANLDPIESLRYE
jgi:putative ABC transport system permease protein